MTTLCGYRFMDGVVCRSLPGALIHRHHPFEPSGWDGPGPLPRVFVTSDDLDDALEACCGREDGRTLGSRMFDYLDARTAA